MPGPPPRCEAVLAAWCDANCPLPTRPLFARLDSNAQGGPPLWRCYASEALTPDRQRYSSGPSYCTRHEALKMQLQACMRRGASPPPRQQRSKQQPEQLQPEQPLQAVVVEPSGTIVQPEQPPAVPDVTVELVVAHCHEPMPWLEDVQRGLADGYEGRPDRRPLSLSLHVYEKCRNSSMPWVRTGWAREKRTLLENKGEECFAFLTHVVERYEKLSDYVVFFQGDGVREGREFHATFRAWGAAVVREGATDVWRSVNDHQYISFASSLASCDAHDAGPLPNCHHGQGRQWVCAEQLFSRHFSEPPPTAFAVYTNAQFGVSRDRVHARPLSFYRGLLGEFEVDTDKECHRIFGPKQRPFRGTCALLEYMWPVVMGEEPVLRVGKTMSGREAWGCIKVSSNVEWAEPLSLSASSRPPD